MKEESTSQNNVQEQQIYKLIQNEVQRNIKNLRKSGWMDSVKQQKSS